MPPIPPPLPPAPYIAPDLRPIASLGTARLVQYRNRETGQLVEMQLEHGIWIAVEGAPLDVRFHARKNGTVFAEQAMYANGDRMGGIASATGTTYDHTIRSGAVGSRLGTLRGWIGFRIRNAAGRVVRAWTAQQCGPFDQLSRLDRPDSPANVTFASSWSFGCGESGPYVLGRTLGLDRGWSALAPSTVAEMKALPKGTYELEATANPNRVLVDADTSNDTTTVKLVVSERKVRVRREEPGVTPISDGSTSTGMIALPDGGIQVGDSRRRTLRIEPTWMATALSRIEARAAAREASGRAALPAPPSNVELPDLRSAPSYGISTAALKPKPGVRTKARDLLHFGALNWNAGPGPLEVEAFRERGDVLDAYQVFFRDGERTDRQRRGTILWHAAPGHNHFHFRAFAHYQLTTMDGRVLRDGGKASWCIVDTDVVDTTLPGMRASGDGDGFGSSDCGSAPGSLWARLSLSVGAGDYYGPGTSGQTFDITALPNGRYKVRIEANPSRVIAETNYDNNVSYRVVTLSGTKGKRAVTPAPDPLINEDVYGDKGWFG